MEGIKVLYRVAIALLLSFTKACNSDSKWSNLLQTSGLDSAISKFCRDITVIFFLVLFRNIISSYSSLMNLFESTLHV